MITPAHMEGFTSQWFKSMLKGCGLVAMMVSTAGLIQAVDAVPEASEARVLLAQDTPVPTTTVKVANNKVTIRLTNRSGEIVNYQVIGNTPTRLLRNNTTVILRDLSLPANLTFNYVELGQPEAENLLKANFSQNAATGLIDVTLNRATNPETAQSYLGIGRKGGVFLY